MPIKMRSKKNLPAGLTGVSKVRHGNITVAIFVHNDQQNIVRAIESAKLLTSAVVVIDIGSTDGTDKRAKQSGAEVLKTKFYPYVELARMEGLKKITSDWIFILDSDEVITQALASEILRAISGQNSDVSKLKTDDRHLSTIPSAYRVPRKNMFGKNKWLKHGGWWPDYQTRLILLKDLQEWSTRIHSTPQIKGEVGLLKEALIHYSHGNISNMVKKTIIFEGMESDLLHKARKKANTFIFFRKFCGELFRRLIKYKGFLDGKEGITESIYQAYSKTITYLMLYEKNEIK
jgi:glycosyltransferase involved in cell wall biosynthesis